MITYELAKELKEAGFPQGTTSSDTHYTFLDADGNPCNAFGREAAYVPTLSELIEACGDSFVRIRRHSSDHWEVWGYGVNEDFIGTTPLEAVARLWLALNK